METWSRCSAAFDCVPQPAACCPDWMAELPDALPLSRLSIPGTHDSLSLFGGRRLRCQSWGLEAQLAAGIRFLDVRCKLSRGELHIYHLCTFQRASLRGVLRRTLRFLRAHPSEAVLMRIKEELPIFSRPGFAAQLHRCLLEEGQGCVWCREEVPVLGQVRGKIVVLEALAREVLGIPYEQLSISDAWNVLSLEGKWARVRRHLEKAAGGDPTTMYLTFCSGNGLFTYPEEVARFVNPRCCQHLRRRAGQPVRWGVVIMDFPGAGLLRLIVESNGPRANGHRTAAPGTPTVPSPHPRSRGDSRRRSQHSSARCPRRCPSGRTLLPAPHLCRRTSVPGGQKQVSRSCRAPGSLCVTMMWHPKRQQRRAGYGRSRAVQGAVLCPEEPGSCPRSQDSEAEPSSARATHLMHGELDGHRGSDSDGATLSLGSHTKGCCTGQSPAVCNSWSSL